MHAYVAIMCQCQQHGTHQPRSQLHENVLPPLMEHAPVLSEHPAVVIVRVAVVARGGAEGD